MEENAVPYIRLLESRISVWDGVSRISLDVGPSQTLAKYVADMYTKVGWMAKVRGTSTTSTRYVIDLE